MMLSRRTKEATKTALAMTISFGIALWLDWDKPMWAGFAVAFISLATVGQSLEKGVLRMLGTLIGAVAALTIMAFFIQERWLFILALSLWVGLCTSLMMGPKHKYMWHVSGFVCVIICAGADRSSADLFMIALLRVEETGLGILVYSLVSIFLWPIRSGTDLEASTSQLLALQQQIYRSCFDMMTGRGTGGDTTALRGREIQLQNGFSQFLDAAQSDTTEVKELRHQWQAFKQYLFGLSATLERWRSDCAALQKRDLTRLLPGLDAFDTEMQRRFSQIEGMAQHKRPEQQPGPVELVPDKKELQKLSHFHRAEAATLLERLQRIDNGSRNLFLIFQEIRGYSPAGTSALDASQKDPVDQGGWTGLPVLDPDRLTAFFQAAGTLWGAYLLLIYVNDLPGGSAIISMGGSMGMLFASAPQMSPLMLVSPVFVSVIFSSILYLFVMPHLSSYASLGLMIFLVTFAICYFNNTPAKALGRALGLALFLSITGISSQQTYNFLVVPSTALMFAILILLLIFAVHFPVYHRPERVFLRLLSRFFHSSSWLVSTMGWDQERRQSLIGSWRIRYHRQVIAAVPDQLPMWAGLVDVGSLQGTNPEDVQGIASDIQVLAFRIEEMLDTGTGLQSASLIETVVNERADMQARLRHVFTSLSIEPAAVSPDLFRQRSLAMADNLEARIEQVLDGDPDQIYSDEEGVGFYSILGTDRGMITGLYEYLVKAASIDWAEWRDSRFF